MDCKMVENTSFSLNIFMEFHITYLDAGEYEAQILLDTQGSFLKRDTFQL